MFISQIENSKDILSVDEAGYIFIWKYEVDHFDDSIQMYRPAYKYRIMLKYNFFQTIERYKNPNPKLDNNRFE